MGSLLSSETVMLLSYRAGAQEPEPEKSFDLSDSGLAERWRVRRLDMEAVQEMLGRVHEGPIIIVRRGSGA